MANASAAVSITDVSLPLAQGRREHMRERLLSSGPDTVDDEEILEMLLFLSISDRETKTLAKAIIGSFGDLGQACQANQADLRNLGLGNASIGIVELVREAARRLDLAEGASRPLIDNEADLAAYLDVPARLRMPAHTAALLLNAQSLLLADMSFPASRPTAEIVRAVTRRAIEVEASTLILATMRPEGQLVAMQREYALGRLAAKLSAALSMVFRNHLIFGADGRISSLHLGVI